MKRKSRILALLMTAIMMVAMLSGCMALDMGVDVKEDGSGKLTYTILLDKALLEQAGGMDSMDTEGLPEGAEVVESITKNGTEYFGVKLSKDFADLGELYSLLTETPPAGEDMNNSDNMYLGMFFSDASVEEVTEDGNVNIKLNLTMRTLDEIMASSNMGAMGDVPATIPGDDAVVDPGFGVEPQGADDVIPVKPEIPQGTRTKDGAGLTAGADTDTGLLIDTAPQDTVDPVDTVEPADTAEPVDTTTPVDDLGSLDSLMGGAFTCYMTFDFPGDIVSADIGESYSKQDGGHIEFELQPGSAEKTIELKAFMREEADHAVLPSTAPDADSSSSSGGVPSNVLMIVGVAVVVVIIIGVVLVISSKKKGDKPTDDSAE